MNIFKRWGLTCTIDDTWYEINNSDAVLCSGSCEDNTDPGTLLGIYVALQEERL